MTVGASSWTAIVIRRFMIVLLTCLTIVTLFALVTSYRVGWVAGNTGYGGTIRQMWFSPQMFAGSDPAIDAGQFLSNQGSTWVRVPGSYWTLAVPGAGLHRIPGVGLRARFAAPTSSRGAKPVRRLRI